MKNFTHILRFCATIVLAFAAWGTSAQSFTILSTCTNGGGSSTSSGNNYCFSVRNNHPMDIKITDIGGYHYCDGAATYDMWYTINQPAATATTATIAAPTWTYFGPTVPAVPPPTRTYKPFFTGISLIVPANSVMRIAFVFPYQNATGQTIFRPSNTLVGGPIFTVNNVDLMSGTNTVSNGLSGTGMNSSGSYPFWGSITWEFNAVPCDDTLESSVVIGPKTICPNKPFNLKIALQNGLNISGLTYQWEYSNNGVVWSNFTGVPNATTGEIGDVIIKDRWYRCRVTCTATGNTYTTPPHKVTIAPFYYCYCDNATTVSTGADIGNVLVTHPALKDTLINTGLANPVYSNTAASRTYTPYHDSVSWPCLYQDSTYNFRVSQINSTASLTSCYVQGYIDYNRDGLYNPNTEKVFNKRMDGTSTPPEVSLANVTIPASAKIGYTGMRIIMSVDSVISAPCDTMTGQGEIQDYVVSICYRPCDGPTNAGIVSSTDTSMCNGYEYTLTDTTYERQRSGFTRSWQISGDNIYWQNVNNSTDKDTLERSFMGQPLYYRLRLVCPGSDDTTYSPPTLVNVKPGYKCYCYSKAIGGTAKDSSDIGGISVNGFVSNSGGPHLLNATANRPRTDYTDMPKLMEMYLDSTYNFSVYHTMKVQEHGDAKVTVFLDFNNNKEYDIPEERVYTGYTSIGYHTLIDNFTIPQYAITDVPTGMRFILNNEVGPNIPSDEACGPYTSGETEDFLVLFRKKPTTTVGEIDQLNGFGIYPNPSTGVVHVNFNTEVKMEELQIRVTNLTGQEIYKQSYSHRGGMFDTELNLGNQARGVYFVELQSNGQRLLQKLVIE